MILKNYTKILCSYNKIPGAKPLELCVGVVLIIITYRFVISTMFRGCRRTNDPACLSGSEDRRRRRFRDRYFRR